MDNPLQRTDDDYMTTALRLARQAGERGEVPVGAVAVGPNGEIVGRAYNQVELLNDGTAHAEMIALTQAAAALGDWRLTEVTLYVTKEPCPMCAGAMVNSRLGRLVFGCADPRGGAAGGALNLLDFPGLLHRVPVTRDIRAAECREIIQEFFRERRKRVRGVGDTDGHGRTRTDTDGHGRTRTDTDGQREGWI